jgi:hypothetical protein
MTVSVLEAFRVEFARQAGKPVFIDQQTTGISFGQYSQWFDLVPQTKTNVLAAYVKYSYTVTGTPSIQTNADKLDILLGQVQIAASARVMPRTQTITRRFFEDVEQITFDTNYSYPRAAPQTSAGTYTHFFYVPVGGTAGALRLLLPSSTNAYTTAAVAINSITVYAIEGDNDTVVAFKENNTPSLGTNIQSVKNYIPDDIAPDVLIMVGDSASGGVTQVTQVFLVEQNGMMLVAATDVDAISNGLLAITPRTGALGNTALPGGATLSIDFGVTLQGSVLKVAQMAFSGAVTHDVGVIQYIGSADVPQNVPQTTPAPPAVNQVGVQNAAGRPVIKGDKMSAGGRPGRGGPPVGSRFHRA